MAKQLSQFPYFSTIFILVFAIALALQQLMCNNHYEFSQEAFEADRTPVQLRRNAKFSNWFGNSQTDGLTIYYPKSIKGIQNIVK